MKRAGLRAMILALGLAACVTTTAPPPGVRSWHGTEIEVVAAIVADRSAPDVLTFLFPNGTYFVLTDLQLNDMQPGSYCFRGLAENNPRYTQGRWQAYDPGGDGRGCAVFRGVVTAWAGDGRDWD